MSEESRKMRIECTENDAKRDAGLTTPDDIVRFDDIRYGEDPVLDLLDVYRPKTADRPLPVIVNVHGGGWVYGTKETYQFYCMSLAQRGFAVVNFSYRLAPESKFPTQLSDINAVAAWIMKNAAEYLLDTDHIFFIGDSAGGNLGALYASFVTDPGYAAQFDFKAPDGFKIRAVCFSCGAYVPLSGKETSPKDKVLMTDLLPHGGTPEEAVLVDSTAHITPAFPPAMLMSCIGDFCRRHVAPMEAALKENGVPVTVRICGTETEPLYHVFHCNIREPEGRKFNDEQCAFFGSFVK